MKEHLLSRSLRRVFHGESQLLASLKMLEDKCPTGALKQLLCGEISKVEKKLDLTAEIKELVADADDEDHEVIRAILVNSFECLDMNEDSKTTARCVVEFVKSAMFYQVAQYKTALYWAEKFRVSSIEKALVECSRDKEHSVSVLAAFQVNEPRSDLMSPGFVYLPPP